MNTRKQLNKYKRLMKSDIEKEHSPLLDSLDSKKRKLLKKKLQSAEPSEYFGQDFTQLGELVDTLRELDLINDYHMYLFNSDGDSFIEALFGVRYSDMEEHRQQYVEKFLQAKAQDPARLWSMLDNDKRQQLIDAVTEKYG